MKRYAIYLSLMSAVAISVSASDNMSLPLHLKLLQLTENPSTRSENQNITVLASFSDNPDMEALEALGASVSINGYREKVITIPAYNVGKLASLHGVSTLDFPRECFLDMNISRAFTGVDLVQTGNPEYPDILPYTGKGVLIGIIDAGIDPKHCTFYDKDLKEYRVRQYVRSYSGSETTSGEYTTVPFEDIENLEQANIDVESMGHGTHTSSIAAGAYQKNGFYGNAIGSDLLLISAGANIFEDEIIGGMQYAAAYAKEHNMPLVMNFSISNTIGAHDGTGNVERALDEIAGPGTIACFSSGNYGQRKNFLKHNFVTDPDEVKFLLTAPGTGRPVSVFSMQAWSEDTKPLKIRLALYDTEEKTISCETPEFSFENQPDGSPAPSPITIFRSNVITDQLCPDWAEKFYGYVLVNGGYYDHNGRYFVEILGNVNPLNGTLRYIPVVILSSSGCENMIVYSEAGRNEITSGGLEGFSEGTCDESISEFCTTENAISVGMLNTNDGFTDYRGKHTEYDKARMGFMNGYNNMSSWGSYAGKGERILPDVVAPGTYISAAFNGNAKVSYNDITAIESVKGRRNYWGQMTGTSMSSPNVAGIIAMWLEANPELTPADIREVFKATGSFTPEMEADTRKCAYGSVNAYDGLKYILNNKPSSVSTLTAESRKMMVRFLDRRRVEIVLDGKMTGGNVSLIGMDGSSIPLGEFHGQVMEVSLPEVNGVYLLCIDGLEGRSATKLVLK